MELLANALALDDVARAALLAAARPSGGDPGGMVVGDALVPLVGRERELTLLNRFLAGERAPLSPAPVLLLAGEPGIGKTRLLQAAAQQAIAQGWCVLVGGCQRRGGLEPYAPFLEALALHIRAAGAAPRGAALAGCAWLVRLLPELAEAMEPLPTGTLGPEQERRLVFAAVGRLLANVAGPAGTLLVLDDLQWAGPDALDLIGTLARGAASTLRLVGAYRDNEVRAADPLGLLLADLAQARLARQHALRPLEATDAAALLQALLVDATEGEHGRAERVLQRAGGSPFFLVSYAQALHQGNAEGVPWDVAQGVRQRLALLPGAGQEVLGAAAVVGRRASRGVLVAVVGRAEEAVLVGLEAACRARLLLEDGDDAYAFAHDVVREVIEAELGAARRAVLHRRVAEALEGGPGGAPPELLAYHYARSGTQDRAALYLEQAGDHAWGQRAHGAAEGHYGEALEYLERLGRAPDALRVREKLGEVLLQAGRYDVAIEALEPAIEALRATGDWEGIGRIALRIGTAHSFRGTQWQGLALIQSLLADLEGSAVPPALAGLYAAYAFLLFSDGQYEACLAAGERAAELARTGDDHMRALVNLKHINHLQMMGRLGEALRVGQELLPLVDARGDALDRVTVHGNLAYIHGLQGSFKLGRLAAERALAAAAPLGEGQLAYLLALRGWLAYLSGEWQRAHVDLDQAVALSRRVPTSWWAAYPLLFQAPLSLAEGDMAATAETLREAVGLAEANGDLQALRWASSIMAELDILEGRAASASARLTSLLDRPSVEECDVTGLLPVLAWAHLELDQVDLAAEVVGHALARARPESMRLVLVEALRVQALVALRRGQWDEAASSLEEGLELARGMPHPYAEARLLQVYGALHAQTGEPAARACLEEARAIFTRLGARMDTERVDQALAGLSQNPSRSQNSPHAVELRVAAAQWAAIAALLPHPARTGRPRADDRRTLEAILYVRRTGCAWAELPAALGNGATAHRRWQEWQVTGLWDQIAAIVPTQPTPLEEHAPTAATGA
jgi:tetratricopeptide (TPR) repeat protein